MVQGYRTISRLAINVFPEVSRSIVKFHRVPCAKYHKTSCIMNDISHQGVPSCALADAAFLELVLKENVNKESKKENGCPLPLRLLCRTDRRE